MSFYYPGNIQVDVTRGTLVRLVRYLEAFRAVLEAKKKNLLATTAIKDLDAEEVQTLTSRIKLAALKIEAVENSLKVLDVHSEDIY